MVFKPVYNPGTAAINTDNTQKIVRDWLETNWNVTGIPANKVDFDFLGEQYSWEGKTTVISTYPDPPKRADFEVSPNSKDINQRIIVDIWVNDVNAFANGKWPDNTVKIMKWIEEFVDSNPGGLQGAGIDVVEYESHNYVQFGSTSVKNWFHTNVFLMLHYLLVKT